MSAWWTGSAVLLDFESDGVDPTDARIITAAAVLIKPGQAPDIMTWMARTDRPIPPEATAVHHVTTAHADEHGQPRDQVVTAVATALGLAGRDVPVIGHNVGRYDLTLLDREMRRLGIGSLGTEKSAVTVRIDGWQTTAFLVIDSLILDKWVDPYRKGRRTLDATAVHYGVPIKGTAHTAEADALAAGRVAWAIAKRCDMAAGETDPGTYDMELQQKLFDLYADRRHPSEVCISLGQLGRMTLPELHHAQISWAADQAAGLRDYFAKNPDKGDPLGVSGAWPLEPVGTVDAVTDLV
jgi:DNA polymerase III subunit epsilon